MIENGYVQVDGWVSGGWVTGVVGWMAGRGSPQLPIVASSIVSLYFLELTDLFKPAQVGFRCYDRTLSMPYVETSEELIPLLMLLSLAFAAPAASPLVHIPEEGTQVGAGLSPKSSAAVRAKWLMMAEKTGPAAAAQPRVANPPRLLQVIAMSKAPGGAGAATKAAETGSSSSASSDSSQYRSPSDRDSASVVTIDAHAPHHPVVHLSAGNGPWEWKVAGGGAKGPDGDGAYELGDLSRGFRGGPRPPGLSPGSSISDVDQEEPRFGAVATVNLATGEGLPPLGAADGALGQGSRESTLRRKIGSLSLGERDAPSMETEAESYYRKMQAARVHVFGLCATALVTDVIQLATGYHAPFFLTVCKPNYTLLGTTCEANPYITQDICAGADTHAILSARKTFPSQHATLSAFAAVYVSMYFNSVISDTTKLLKPILVFAFAIGAGVCGLTQITQYRSHPVDVYAGFLIGAGIAAYLACHAVGNFQAPPAERPAAAAPPPAKDALRALTQRGHDSVYQQHKSASTDELGPPGRLEGAPRPVARDKSSLGSLKRASVDVDLLAPRSPMGKESMVTFSNTLPRVSTPSLDDPARRHMTIHVPLDASRSKQLISEWKQKSLEGR
ncbi:phospholipid phosphatase-related protein type 3, partial [Echinops telfairi]|uniref:Phospholipid phosphatase-related protein type 3 n=1 Tax=Echinops telfairi TaxID=9371 RepID=A0AC55DW48_ECHTE